MEGNESLSAGHLLFQQIHALELRHSRAVQRFLSADIDRVSILHNVLRSTYRNTAVGLLPYIKIEELKQLFPDLLSLASYQSGLIAHYRAAIVRLPRDWVLANINVEAEPLIRDGSDEEYRRLLELYILLDRNLTRKLANKALANDNVDIREAGEDALQWLELPNEQLISTRRNLLGLVDWPWSTEEPIDVHISKLMASSLLRKSIIMAAKWRPSSRARDSGVSLAQHETCCPLDRSTPPL